MKLAQKIIKSFAIILAISIIASILTTGVYIFNLIGSKFEDYNINNTEKELKSELKEVNGIIDYLDINLKSTNLIIKNGDKFTIDTNNKYIELVEDNNKLIVKDKRKEFISNKDYFLTITLPRETQSIYLNSGASNIDIDNIKVNNLEFLLGIGKVNINNLMVYKSAKIDGGAGKIAINNSTINNLKLDLGIGSTTINSVLVGNSDIDAGVGSLKLNLSNKENEYTFDIDKGIGSIKLNNKSINDGIIGTGTNKLEIDGGVGSIDITTID